VQDQERLVGVLGLIQKWPRWLERRKLESVVQREHSKALARGRLWSKVMLGLVVVRGWLLPSRVQHKRAWRCSLSSEMAGLAEEVWPMTKSGFCDDEHSP
jgi:hypothetical protein